MRYFFHIVDRYGLSPDLTGCEHASRDAAVVHARRIATELGKPVQVNEFNCGEIYDPQYSELDFSRSARTSDGLARLGLNVAAENWP